MVYFLKVDILSPHGKMTQIIIIIFYLPLLAVLNSGPTEIFIFFKDVVEKNDQFKSLVSSSSLIFLYFDSFCFFFILLLTSFSCFYYLFLRREEVKRVNIG